MSYLRNVKKYNLAAHVITVLFAAEMTAVGIIVYGADVSALCLFVLFMIVYVMVPGYVITRLLKIDTPHLSTILALSLYSGWALCVLLYFLADIIRFNLLVAAGCPLITVCWLIHEIKKPKEPGRISVREHISRIPVSFCIFFVLVLLYALMTTQYLYMSPDLSASINVNPDKAYHMGLIDSLSHDYPLQSPWIQGRFISYHIFTEVLYAIPVRLFGMEADFLLLSCGPYLTTFAICTSMYSFFAELSHKAERAGAYCLIVILSNPFIAKTFCDSIAFKFIITNDNTSGYGVMSSMTFVVLLKYFFEEYEEKGKRIPWGLTALLTALMLLIAGIKGPMGIVLLASFWGTLFLGWILRQSKFNLAIPAVTFTAAFAIVYMTILGAKGRGEATGGNTLFDFANITNICYWKDPLIEHLKAAALPLPARLVILMIVFLLFYLTAFFIPLIVGYIRELFLVLTKKKPYVFYEVIVYAAFLVGFIAMFLLRYSGHSQIYFGLLSLFFAPLISFWYLEGAEDRYRVSKGFRKGLYIAMLSVFVVSLAGTTMLLTKSLLNIYPDDIRHADPTVEYDMYTSMSNDEYQAMEWIEDNTPSDALLATDRYYSVPLDKYSYEDRWSNRFFLYASYSNRFCYIAGSGYNLGRYEWPTRLEMIKKNAELYDPDNDARGDTARELGIDYVIVSKRFTDIPSLENKDYELCYQNDDIDIYEIKDAS
ncbi:MAG: hypothetical protein IJH28_02470 [Mogibacterium sp.]|nr:hypothetical protein [Mogibacterium sp.]MBQ6501530.1 hypothetical protein [Mogibacterium sp.]